MPQVRRELRRDGSPVSGPRTIPAYVIVREDGSTVRGTVAFLGETRPIVSPAEASMVGQQLLRYVMDDAQFIRKACDDNAGRIAEIPSEVDRLLATLDHMRQVLERVREFAAVTNREGT